MRNKKSTSLIVLIGVLFGWGTLSFGMDENQTEENVKMISLVSNDYNFLLPADQEQVNQLHHESSDLSILQVKQKNVQEVTYPSTSAYCDSYLARNAVHSQKQCDQLTEQVEQLEQQKTNLEIQNQTLLQQIASLEKERNTSRGSIRNKLAPLVGVICIMVGYQKKVVPPLRAHARSIKGPGWKKRMLHFLAGDWSTRFLGSVDFSNSRRA